MGSCVGKGPRTTSKDLSKNPSQHRERDVVLEAVSQDPEDGHLITKLLADVNVLSSDDGALRWQSLFHGLVPVSLFCYKQGKVFSYLVSATGVDGTAFTTNIHIPGTRLRKTSACFIQWRDTDIEGGWGLNFVVEADAMKFLEGCSPPTLTPTSGRLRHTLSTLSLSLPIPEPPTHIEDTQLDEVILQAKVERGNTVHRVLDLSSPVIDDDPPSPYDVEALSPSMSPTSEFGDEDLTLFEPTSPHKIIPQEFLLPDIDEESESASRPLSTLSEVQGVGSHEPESEIKYRLHSSKQRAAETLNRRSIDYTRQSFEEAGLDVIETKFNKEPGDQLLNRIVDTMSEMSTSFEGDKSLPEPPFLPVSPPPGPLLSPRYSMLLAALEESKANAHTVEDKKRASAMINRLSTISLIDDEPPPLPQTLPPGKMMSPRHSKLLIQGGDTSELSQLDLSILLSKMTTIYDEKNKTTSESDQNQASAPELEDHQILALLPPPNTEEETVQRRRSSLKLTPSFLRSIEPPEGFSDSGLPETDETPATSEHTPNKITSQLSNRKDSSATETTFSEEKLSEYSGSIGHKVSTSRQWQDDDASSLSTKVGGEMDIPGAALFGRSSTEHTTRKTGWLEVKPVLVSKNKKVGNTAKTKRKWKKYWVTLKGLHLLLHQCDDESSLREDAHVDYKFDLELCLVHPVHDHVKRENVFCITTASGSAYYLQALAQSEVDDWITTIHCASATAVTGHTSREESVQIIKKKKDNLSKSIEKEKQLRNMTELNLSTASDQTAKAMGSDQVQVCSENIEKYSVELYRLRCYTAALEGAELPNPQTLLGCVSKPTKLALGRVGMFSVSALTAQVNARHGLASSLSSATLSIPLSRSNSKKKAKPSTPKATGKSLRSMGISDPLPVVKPKVSAISLLTSNYDSCDQVDTTDVEDYHGHFETTEGSLGECDTGLNMASVGLPSGKLTRLIVRIDMTVNDLLKMIAEKHRLNYSDHYVRLKLSMSNGVYGIIPNGQELLVDLVYTSIDVCQKCVHTVILKKDSNAETGFGVTLTPCWAEDESLSSVIVAGVGEEGVAQNNRLNIGDEIMLVNDTGVTELEWGQLEAMLQSATTLSLTVRTCFIDSLPSSSTVMDSLICPAPPPLSNPDLSGDMLKQLTVPNPDFDNDFSLRSTQDVSGENLEQLMKHSKEMSKLLRVWKMQSEDSSPWTKDDQLKKAATDLLETEAEYIRCLNVLLDRYLYPIQRETFLSKEEMGILCGDIVELVGTQKKFFTSLKESISLVEGNMQQSTLKQMVEGISKTFRENQSHFREYSTFCASHRKAQDLNARVEDQQLQSYLEARNPHQDSSLSLSTLLSKPIVRISRYPLFMKAILDNTDKESEERNSIREAIEMMSTVTNHINEMQRVCEAYQLIFESLLKSSHITEVQLSISISELKYHGEAKWLNPSVDNLSRGLRKGQGPVINCFVFKSVIILLCIEKRQKRKESRGPREITVMEEDVRYKAMLPCVYCRLHDFPNSDGVSNMWQIQYRPKSGSTTRSNYLFRNNDPEDKLAFLRWVDYVTTDQRRIYSSSSVSSSGRSTPTLTSPHHSPSLTQQPATVTRTLSLSPLSQ